MQHLDRKEHDYFSSRPFRGVRQSRSSTLSHAELLNSSIQTDSTHDTNERFVNDLFLSTITQGNLPDDELEIEQLWSIATQYPLQGGDAVFRARGICRLFDPLHYFPNDSVCQYDTLELRESPKTVLQPVDLTYDLFPNPSNGQSPQIAFNTVLPESIDIRVFSTNGVEVSSLTVRAGIQVSVITNNNLRPGVYLCVITSKNGKHLPSERFVVIE